jgi:hypothetical protein
MNTETLLKAIEDETGITLTQIQSKCRKEQFVYARRIITHHMANIEGYPDRYIAAFINRNRSTVNLMRRGHKAEYDNNPGFRRMFDAITMSSRDISDLTGKNCNNTSKAKRREPEA